MNSLLIVLLLQSLLLPPRVSLENPSAVSTVPQKLKKDYDKAWALFVNAKEDPKLAKELEKLNKKQKNFDAVLTIQAYLDLYAKNDADAQRKFEELVSRDDDNRIALYYLAEFAYLRGDYGSANDYYTRLLKTDNSRPELETKRNKVLLLATENLLRKAARAESENRFAEAEGLYRQALSIAPSEPGFHGRLADLYARQQKWDEALTQYRQQAEFEGGSGDTDKRIAETLMNLGRTEEARDILSRLRDSGNADEVLEEKVLELNDLGRWGGDIARFREIEAAASLSREQLCAMLVRYFPQITEFRQTPQIVTDVEDSWARTEIQTIVGVGLIAPYPNHTFQPGAAVTRGDFARALARMMRVLSVSPNGAPPIATADVSQRSPFHADVQLVLGYDLMTLDDAGNFNLDAEISGEEAVWTVEKLLLLARGKDA
jgi:tetratricopeptide (TPR) repeat protein